MRRAVPMVIEFTGYDRPRRLASTTHLSSMDLQGTLTFDPIPEGTRMQWSWDVEPKGVLKVMTPLVALMGRRQEQRIWTGLKHLLEGQTGHGNAAREQALALGRTGSDLGPVASHLCAPETIAYRTPVRASEACHSRRAIAASCAMSLGVCRVGAPRILPGPPGP